MADFKLKNYTTEVAASRSIAQIEELLLVAGATDIIKRYDSAKTGKVTMFAFRLSGNTYQLPVNEAGVYKVLHGSGYPDQKKQEQAERVAWRILKDWLHAQLSLVKSGQALPDQILLPYLFNGTRTMYQAWKDGQLQLTDGSQPKKGIEEREGR